MKIGIDVSQVAHEGSGVANYLTNLVEALITFDRKNEYILFFSSLRKCLPENFSQKVRVPNVQIKRYWLPPTILDVLWNRLHIIPIEYLLGDIDIFITSDWVEPPAAWAKKVTIIYDFIIYKYPEETHNMTRFNKKSFTVISDIVGVQKRKLKWVEKESSMVFCISESTKKDAMEILGLNEKKLQVIYPGFSLHV